MVNLDIIVIVLYMLGLMGFGFWLYRKESLEGFFVNNRNTHTTLLVFTALSTSLGAGTAIGMATSAYSTGISLGFLFAVVSVIGWTVVALLAPRIKRMGDRLRAFTVGDFLKDRFSNRTKTAGGIVILSASLLAAALQFSVFARLTEVIGGVNFNMALLIAAVVTIAYTVLAGLKGDFYTDAIQFFVMMPVFIFLLIVIFTQVNIGTLFSNLPEGHLDLFNYSGPVFFFAGLLFGIPLLLVSMDVWQRIFAAFDEKTARRSFFIAGFVKVLFIAVVVLIGLAAVSLVPGVEGDASFFILMKEFLPPGILGLGFASILAIIMSTLDSLLMVGSATFTRDFYLHKFPALSDIKQLMVGRVSVLVLGIIATFIAFIFQDIEKLLVVSAQIPLVMGPALIGGLLWSRSNEKAAFWSITLGFAVTLAVLPFATNFAFIPGILVSLIVFFLFIFWGTSRMQSK